MVHVLYSAKAQANAVRDKKQPRVQPNQDLHPSPNIVPALKFPSLQSHKNTCNCSLVTSKLDKGPGLCTFIEQREMDGLEFGEEDRQPCMHAIQLCYMLLILLGFDGSSLRDRTEAIKL